MKLKRYAAFTLVELLVVIGIIALLISILLPALGKARAQANTVTCSSNLRSMGQLINIYASENKGFLPYGYGGVPITNSLQEWYWPDTLTLLNAPQNYASIQVPANGYYPPISQSNASADYLPLFHDVDVPELPFAARSCCYNGNPRLLPNATAQDPTLPVAGSSGTYQYFHHRSLASVNNPSEKMLIWDGSVIFSNMDYGTTAMVDNVTDGAQWNFGHCFCTTGLSYYPTAQYGTRISLGNWNNTSSANVGSVTKSVLLVGNKDLNGQYYDQWGMRFRHNNNNSCNSLYVDGHVESKHLGDVLAIDVCVNP